MSHLKRLLLAASLPALLVVASASRASAAEVYAAPVATEVRSQALQWVAAQGVKDQAVLEAVGNIWVLPEAGLPPRKLLATVVQTFELVDADAKTLVAACSLTDPALLPPDAKLLAREGLDPFYRANLRLFYARYLAQRRMYDEALAQFDGLDPKAVVDPATCLFYKAVCEHQLLMKKEGLETIDKLLTSTEEVPVSYSSVATLMQYELQQLNEQTLDQVSRMMRDVERRLDLARGGPKVQKQEDEIVEVLSKIIEKLEQQQGGGSGSGGQNSQSRNNQSSSPAQDSTIKGNVAPGNVDKKDFRAQGGWGNLPEKEEARAKNLINRNLPPHYKQATEQYFKKIAKYRMKARTNR